MCSLIVLDLSLIWIGFALNFIRVEFESSLTWISWTIAITVCISYDRAYWEGCRCGVREAVAGGVPPPAAHPRRLEDWPLQHQHHQVKSICWSSVLRICNYIFAWNSESLPGMILSWRVEVCSVHKLHVRKLLASLFEKKQPILFFYLLVSSSFFN